MPTDAGTGGLVRAGGIAVGGTVATAAMRFGPTRDGLSRFVFPDPGEGPTRERIENGYFTVRVLGRGTATDGPFAVDGRIAADLDPGYGATARMVSAAAMCLVDERIDSPLAGGILTPASGIGSPLVDRLRAVGLTVDVGEWDRRPV